MPADDGSEPINVATDLNDNLEKLDSTIGFVPSTSTTPPSTVYDGMATYETDTGRAKFRKGGVWNYLATAGASFLSDLWLGIGQKLGLGTTTPTAVIEAVVSSIVTAPTLLKFRQNSDTNPRMQIDVDGIKIGPGDAATDIQLYRPSANQLAVVGNVSVGSSLSVSGATSLASLNLSGDLSVGGSITGDLAVAGDLSVTGIGMFDTRIRTVDLSRANTTTPVADTVFDYWLEANSTYYVELLASTFGSATGDFKTVWSIPAGASGIRWALGMATGGTDSYTTTMLTAVFAPTTNIIMGTQSTSIATGSQETLVIFTGATAGTMQFLWSQGSTNATATTLRAGSIMKIRKVA
jgi:hypothetical protein